MDKKSIILKIGNKLLFKLTYSHLQKIYFCTDFFILCLFTYFGKHLLIFDIKEHDRIWPQDGQN